MRLRNCHLAGQRSNLDARGTASLSLIERLQFISEFLEEPRLQPTAYPLGMVTNFALEISAGGVHLASKWILVVRPGSTTTGTQTLTKPWARAFTRYLPAGNVTKRGDCA